MGVSAHNAQPHIAAMSQVHDADPHVSSLNRKPAAGLPECQGQGWVSFACELTEASLALDAEPSRVAIRNNRNALL